MTCCGHPNTCERPCFHGGSITASEAEIGAAIRALHPHGLDTSWFLGDEPKAPKKPSLDAQCGAAMWRLKAHIDSRCAEHREAIRANHAWDVRNMRERHAMTLDLIEMLRDDFPTPGPLQLLESLL